MFPGFNDKGTAAFSAKLKSGGAGIFTTTNSNLTTVFDSTETFERFRGALINNSGEIIFFAAPVGGELGIFNGPDPVNNKILSIGDSMFDSETTDFALNPVSFNDHNQIAIRIKLANDRQLIIRADPV